MIDSVTDISYGIVPYRLTARGVRVLVVQHRAGHWGFPKGHPEPDETALQTAQRELQEEVGLATNEIADDTPVSQLYSYDHEGQTIHKTVYFYLATTTGEARLRPDEIQAYRWVSLVEAQTLLPVNSADLMEQIKVVLRRKFDADDLFR